MNVDTSFVQMGLYVLTLCGWTPLIPVHHVECAGRFFCAESESSVISMIIK